MTPHLEVSTGGKWQEVPATKHVTGEIFSNNAQLSHCRAQENPNNYREVADEAGEVCPGHKQSELLKQPEPLTPSIIS